MYIFSQLNNYNKKVNIGIIGCGKFITMFLSQVPNLKNINIDCIVDINIKNARNNFIKSGLGKNYADKVHFFKNIDELLSRKLDVVIEATGNAVCGVIHAIKILENKKNLIMVNVEALVLCGKYLYDLAKENSTILSLAYGDQPALIIEQIEWAKLNGFEIVSAGKGTKYHSSFEYSTPDTVWQHYGINEKEAIKAGMNAKMFNSFITGDKSSIEMATVVNSSDLICSKKGLSYHALNIYELPEKLIPLSQGGLLEHNKQVDVISSIDNNKKEISNNLRWGTFVVFKANNNYIKNCFKEYGLITDKTGYFSALWRPYHFIGLELATSIYSVAIEKKATGSCKFYKSDVVAVAKKKLIKGEFLDGEGGYSVRGKLIDAEECNLQNYLPIGLSDKAVLKNNIDKDDIIKLSDVNINVKHEIIVARDYQKKIIENNLI